MSQLLADSLNTQFKQLTGINLTANFMEKGSHSPSKLEKDEKGVYVFLLNENICFKVGKADSKSQARWNSHHYCLDKSTASTFTKSFIKDIQNFKKYFDEDKIIELEKIISNIDSKNKRKELRFWIQNNISRIEFKLINDNSHFTLDLLEKFMAYKLEPIYEGKKILHKSNY